MTTAELNTIAELTAGQAVSFDYPDREHGGFKTVEGIVEIVAENKAGQAYVKLTNNGQFRSYTAEKIRFV